MVAAILMVVMGQIQVLQEMEVLAHHARLEVAVAVVGVVVVVVLPQLQDMVMVQVAVVEAGLTAPVQALVPVAAMALQVTL
ncbi:hypothetical protein [Candidatus Igneacidithiobacillus taiwanensis]|uniref:hypothetical protein n=1 Tax=Candidatus Igneacidithiobacillus taiwanensis TaxID=1945924 RepID=UPI0028987260|nr:hypothetical protein [Candidatus Igneacidithiobacillus taiwanensis]